MFNFNKIEKKAAEYKRKKIILEELQKEVEALKDDLINTILTAGEVDQEKPNKGKLTAGLYKLSCFPRVNRYGKAGYLDFLKEQAPDMVGESETITLKVS